MKTKEPNDDIHMIWHVLFHAIWIAYLVGNYTWPGSY